jgi:hypothetical protein
MQQLFEFNFISFFLYNKTTAKKCSSESKKGFLFASITLLIGLFVNCSESKDKVSVERTISGSMKVM